MNKISVNWGASIVELSFTKSTSFPPTELITSVHGLCFYDKELLLVRLHSRGWDFPGGHMEKGETPEQCLTREVLEEAYAEGTYELLGYICVDHSNNPNWNSDSPYPKIGYQAFYVMNITSLHPYLAEHEAGERIFIDAKKICQFYSNWHTVYQEILDTAWSKISLTCS